MGYLGVSWGDTNARSSSQDWGARASFMLGQLCSLITTGAEITLRLGIVGIISPNASMFPFHMAQTPMLPEQAVSCMLPYPACVLHLGSEVMKHYFCHPLLVMSKPRDRELPLPLEGTMIFCREVYGGKVNRVVTFKKRPASPVMVLSLIRVTHSDTCELPAS